MYKPAIEQSFQISEDGFYGYLKASKSKDFVVILYVDDDPDSMIGKGAVKWFVSQRINVLAMSPGPKTMGLQRVPIEQIETAVAYLRKQGFGKIGIMGLSSTAMISLAAASLIPDITLTVACTPCDFIMEGTIQDNLDGVKERPASQSALTYRDQQLPYLPYPYRHPEYWQQISAEAKRRGDFLAAVDLFDEAEKCHPLQEEEFIKVENIQGHLVLIGAKDDAMWNTTRYIDRMVTRLESHPHSCTYETMIFDHGTHFVFPEGIVKKIVPVGIDMLLPKLFSEAKGYTKECRQTRLAIEKRVLELCRTR